MVRVHRGALSQFAASSWGSSHKPVILKGLGESTRSVASLSASRLAHHGSFLAIPVRFRLAVRCKRSDTVDQDDRLLDHLSLMPTLRLPGARNRWALSVSTA